MGSSYKTLLTSLPSALFTSATTPGTHSSAWHIVDVNWMDG